MYMVTDDGKGYDQACYENLNQCTKIPTYRPIDLSHVRGRSRCVRKSHLLLASTVLFFWGIFTVSGTGGQIYIATILLQRHWEQEASS